MKRQCVLVCPVRPDPRGSGLEQRAFHLLAWCAAQYEVTLVLAGVGSGGLLPGVRALIVECVEVRTPAPATMGERAALLFPPLAWVWPGLAAGWLAPAPGASLPALPRRVALLLVFRLRSVGLARALFAGRAGADHTMLDLDDHESVSLWSIARRAFLRGRLRLALRHAAAAVQMAGLERRLLRTVDEVTFANPADRPALRRLVRTKEQLRLHGNRVLLPARADRIQTNGPITTLLFLGTLSYFPNEDGALWLAERVLPELRRQMRSPFRLWIAGRNATPRLLRTLGGVAEVEHLGAVDDLVPLYTQTDVALVPVRCGGGTKVKLLEAVAHGVPVVAMAHSLRGLPFVTGEEVLCASDAAGFARGCALLQRSPELRESLAQRAYARAATLFRDEDSRSRPPSSR